MEKNFILQIEEAESKAESIIEEAKAKAKDMIEQSNRELNQKLERSREELNSRLRTEKEEAEKQADAKLTQTIDEEHIPEVSEEKRTEATEAIMERIVTFLGNS